jgi:hypothetical protein
VCLAGRLIVTAAILVGIVLALHPWVHDAVARVTIVLAVWISFETMLLRFASNEQLKEARRAERTAANPYVFHQILEDAQGADEYTYLLMNVSDRLALNLYGFRLFTNTDEFCSALRALNYLEPGEKTTLEISPARYDWDDFGRRLAEMLTAVDTRKFMSIVSSAKQSARGRDIIGLIYCDNLANHYTVMRAAEIRDFSIEYRATPWAAQRQLLNLAR